MIEGIAVFLAVIIAVVGIHEMGHYLACRALGVPVEEFAIGVGPRLFGYQAKSTAWNLRVIPLGGYISMDSEKFEASSPWRRIVIALAGPFANLLPFICLALYGKGLWFTVKLFGILYWETMKAFGTIFLSPFKWLFGWFHTAPHAVSHAVEKVQDTAVGPIGMGQMTTRATESIGASSAFLGMFVLLSIGLAFTNLMPILPLDGGRVVNALLDKVFGKENGRLVRSLYTVLGLVALLIFLILITVKDIIRLF